MFLSKSWLRPTCHLSVRHHQNLPPIAASKTLGSDLFVTFKEYRSLAFTAKKLTESKSNNKKKLFDDKLINNRHKPIALTLGRNYCSIGCLAGFDLADLASAR